MKQFAPIRQALTAQQPLLCEIPKPRRTNTLLNYCLGQPVATVVDSSRE